MKNTHFKDMFKNFEKVNDTKQIYGMAKKLLNWKNGSAPRTFLIQGNIIRRPVELASAQMSYYKKKVRSLMEQLPICREDPLKWLIQARGRWDGRNNIPTFNFRKVTVEETVRMIGKLSNSSAYGIDLIDALSVKLVTSHLARPLQHLINVSLMQKRYANRWKLSKLFPLLKDNNLDKLDPASYRPVAILPTFSKLVERAAHSQLLEHMEKSEQLNANTHAYRVGHSTTTAMLEVTNKLYSAVERKELCSVMTIDQKAAFDCVSHRILLRKLRMYGVSEETCKWFKCYLSNRTQFVMIGRAQSQMETMENGVPQGSILGPLLFSIYTNELTESTRNPDCKNNIHLDNTKLFGWNCIDCGTVDQYADDTTYTISSKKRQNNQRKLTENLENIRTFLNTNMLTINMGKTKTIELMIKQKKCRMAGRPPTLTVRTEDNQIKEIEDAEVCRILGLNLQKNITWKSHLETGNKALLPAVRKCLGSLKHVGKMIPRNSRNILARGLISSKLMYLIGIWGGTTRNLRRKAQTVLNTAARWVTNLPRKTRTSSLMEAAGWHNIEEMTEISSATILWRIIHMGKPKNLHRLLNWIQPLGRFTMLSQDYFLLSKSS